MASSGQVCWVAWMMAMALAIVGFRENRGVVEAPYSGIRVRADQHGGKGLGLGPAAAFNQSIQIRSGEGTGKPLGGQQIHGVPVGAGSGAEPGHDERAVKFPARGVGKPFAARIKQLGSRVHLPGTGEGTTGGGEVFEPLGPVEQGEVKLGCFLGTSVRMGFNRERFEDRRGRREPRQGRGQRAARVEGPARRAAARTRRGRR